MIYHDDDDDEDDDDDDDDGHHHSHHHHHRHHLMVSRFVQFVCASSTGGVPCHMKWRKLNPSAFYHVCGFACSGVVWC